MKKVINFLKEVIQLRLFIIERCPIDELKRFQEDRLLHKQDFDLRVATINILEELLEIHGVKDYKDRKIALHAYSGFLHTIDYAKTFAPEMIYEVTEDDLVDGFSDIQVFADGENRKLGYDNRYCLYETAKEINSRTGLIVNGKFTKDTSPEAKSKWYKADYSKCKVK